MTESVNNFGDLDGIYSEYAKSKFVVLPVPYEKTTTYVKGTVNGPKAIIDASCNMELFDEELGCTPAESGIATLNPLEIDSAPQEMVNVVRASCSRVLADGKLPVILGGEHSISVGCVLAVKDRLPDVSVLQFDAHADLRDTYEGSKFNHACTMARIREHADAVQVGVRSLSEEEAEVVKKLRLEKKLFYTQDILDGERTADILNGLGDKVYISFDVDCLDPSIMPSTGTSEPGGLGWYDVLGIMRKVAQEKTVVGFDMVELCPNPYNKAPDFTIAKLTYKLMGYVRAFDHRI